jgi:hypothetical protein
VTWLIRLYPPAWRRRYGHELADLLDGQPASFRTSVDLIAGAVDAWLNPQSSTAITSADAKGGGTMLPRMLQLKCRGYAPGVTKADSFKAAAVTIGGSLALVVVLLAAIARYGKNPYFDSFMALGWLVPFLFSQHYTTCKGRPARVQAVLIGVPVMVVMAIALGTGWLNFW